MNYYKRLDEFLKKNPGYNLVFFVLVMGVVQIIINIARHRSVFQNMEGFYLLAGVYAIAWGLSKLKISKLKIFLIAYVLSFLMLCISLLFEGSYYDYTSFLIMGLFAIVVTLIIMVTIAIIKRSKKG